MPGSENQPAATRIIVYSLGFHPTQKQGETQLEAIFYAGTHTA